MGDSIEFEEVLGEEEATGNDSFTMKVFLDPDIQMTCPFLIFRIPFSFQSFSIVLGLLTVYSVLIENLIS